ncbi:MAG: hypothetical protein LC119_10690 [Burkholderiales bacterium]|nr:hypothetical protein [Burkholderiales bacterium]
MISGVLGFLVLLVLVRLLSTQDYGVYVTLLAWLELTVAIAGLGIPWIGSRFVPQYRLFGSGVALSRFCFRLLCWLLASLAITVIAMGALLQPYLALAGLAEYDSIAWLYLIVIFSDGLTRLMTTSLLDPLMRQGLVRVATGMRQAIMLVVLLGLAFTQDAVRFVQVAVTEVAAAFLATSLVLAGLRFHLVRIRSQSGAEGWVEPRVGDMWRSGLHMHASYLLTLPCSPQALVVLVTRTLGAEAAAVFGFLRALYTQIANYLPATLLFSLLRPRLVAGFAASRDAKALNREANLAGKLSLFVVMPVIAYIGVAGETLVDWLSGGRIAQTGLLFPGLLLTLIPLSQRQLLETVAVTTGHAQMCSVAAAFALVALLLFPAGVKLDLGLWAPVLTIALGQMLFNAGLVIGLRRALAYRMDWIGGFKICLCATVVFAVLAVPVFLLPAAPMPRLATQLVAVAGVYLVLTWMIKPFDREERERLNRFLGRKIWLW